MAEEPTTEGLAGTGESAPSRKPTPRPAAPRPSAGARGDSASLETERGTTSIADLVVTKVAAIATREVGGVHDLGGGAARGLGAVSGMMPGPSVAGERTRGVSVEVGEREAVIDLTIVVSYGESIPRVSEEVRETVIRRVEGITGLSVIEVNISVNDLYFPGDEVEETRVA